MGHDLDQVMRHAPGALAALRQQRALIDQQIQSLEHMIKAHKEVSLTYNVDEQGLVDGVTKEPPSVDERRTLREQVFEAVETIGSPLTAMEVAQLIGADNHSSVRMTLSNLSKQGKIDRVDRGVYRAAVS